MILRVVGSLPSSTSGEAAASCSSLRASSRVTFVPVDETSTVADVASKALAAFVAAEKAAGARRSESGAAAAASPPPCRFADISDPPCLVIENGRNRVEGCDIAGGVGEHRGELSQILDGAWLVLPYMQQQQEEGQSRGNAAPVAPWNVVAYLAFKHPESAHRKGFFVPPVESAPPLPDGRAVQQVVLNDSESPVSAVLPNRLRAIADDQKPVLEIG